MIRLPLSALKGMCCRRRRLQDFRRHHLKNAGEDSTWAEWLAVTPMISDRLWAVMVALPRVYPEHRAALRKIPQEVAQRAAARVETDFPPGRREARIANGTIARIHGYLAWAAAEWGARPILDYVTTVCFEAKILDGTREEVAQQLQDLDELLAKVIGGAP